MPDSIPCLVLFCRCTAPAERYPVGHGILCAKHWRAVPRALKAYRRRARMTVRASAADDEAARWHAVHRLVAAERRDARLWRICKRKAIEAAGCVR